MKRLSNGKATDHCYRNCIYFSTKGNIVCCTHVDCPPQVGDFTGDIITFPKCKTGFPDLCPLEKIEEENEIDIRLHYFINKNTDDEVDMPLVITSIIKYIQNNDVYFDYEPRFFEGVLIFGIIGTEEDHKSLQSVLGGDINKLGCKLNIQNPNKIG